MPPVSRSHCHYVPAAAADPCSRYCVRQAFFMPPCRAGSFRYGVRWAVRRLRQRLAAILIWSAHSRLRLEASFRYVICES